LCCIDLNADLAEGAGGDCELLDLVSSASLACGLHAGDFRIMARTVDLALERGVRIGAHPGYPDLQGFGRRSMQLEQDEIRALLHYQLGALQAIARSAGAGLQHVKLHGALYNDAAADARLAAWVIETLAEFDSGLLIFGPPASQLEKAAQKKGLPFVAEFFADRVYGDDGSLLPRSRPGAVLDSVEASLRQVLEFVQFGRVTTVSGGCLEIKARTICLHGDNPAALAQARAIRAALLEKGVLIAPFSC